MSEGPSMSVAMSVTVTGPVYQPVEMWRSRISSSVSASHESRVTIRKLVLLQLLLNNSLEVV